MAHSELEQAAALATALGLGGVIKGLVDAALARWGPKKSPKRPVRRPSLLADARRRAEVAAAEAELKRHEATRVLIEDYKDQLGFVRGQCDGLEVELAAERAGRAECERLRLVDARSRAEADRKIDALRAELDAVVRRLPELPYPLSP